MNQVYYATTNLGKFITLQKDLKEHNISLIRADLKLPELQSEDLKVISGEKVRFAIGKLKKPCIAQDSALFIYSLEGFPNTYVKYALETIKIEGILKLLEGKPRGCEFRNCLAYLDSSLSNPMFFESESKGILIPERRGKIRGESWSNLDLIFIPESYEKTVAELDDEEFKEWRAYRSKFSYSTKFASWFSQERKL
ncbi:MAG: non-canonical purine NTP pyrophosphatase [archaeon]